MQYNAMIYMFGRGVGAIIGPFLIDEVHGDAFAIFVLTVNFAVVVFILAVYKQLTPLAPAGSSTKPAATTASAVAAPAPAAVPQAASSA